MTKIIEIKDSRLGILAMEAMPVLNNLFQKCGEYVKKNENPSDTQKEMEVEVSKLTDREVVIVHEFLHTENINVIIWEFCKEMKTRDLKEKCLDVPEQENVKQEMKDMM